MNDDRDRPFEALERIFHEPSRLAIMSALCAAERGVSFSDLKQECGLTDGNLNRHLKVLQEARVVTARKAFVHDKPRTTVFITRTGLKRFHEYLEALAQVLATARNALTAETKRVSVPLGRTVEA